MRIAIITPGFSASEEDWCIPALLDLVRVLAREHEVTVITLRYPHRRSVYTVYGARVISLGGATVGGMGRLALIARAVAALWREGRETSFDLLHAFWADEPGFVAICAGRILGRSTVVSLAGGELERMKEIDYGHGLSLAARAFVNISLRGATRVTVGSRFLQERARSRVGSDRLVRLPLGVDTSRFSPAAPAGALGYPNRINLINVASLLPVKDHRSLLDAFRRIGEEEPRAHLHLIGEGPRRAALERQARALGLATRVTFHGAVGHGSLPDYYRAADLFLLSSLYESQCMALLEAAACGVPTVGAAVGVLPEMAPRGAVAVPPGDPNSLAEATIGLLRGPGQRERLARAASALARERYSLEYVLARLLALYGEVGEGATPEIPA